MSAAEFNLYQTWRRYKEYRHRCASNLHHFRTHLRMIEKPLPAKHLDYLGHEITDFLTSGDSILIVLMPPGSAKTELVGRQLPAMVFGMNPTARILSISASAQLAEKSGAAIKQIIESERYQEIFPGMGISTKSSSVTDFAVILDGRPSGVDRGTFRAFGITSAILGNRAEIVILDDVVSVEAANNQTSLNKIYDTYSQAIITRLTPRSKMIVICQRLNVNDIAGRIMADAAAHPTGRKLRLVRLPMLCDDPETDPLGRALGDPLWPEYFTPEMLADAQRNEMIWRTLYMQQPPSDSGSKIPPENIQIVDIVPFADINPRYMAMDIALSENRGDYTVILVATVDAGRNLYIVDAWRKKVEPGATVQRLLNMVEEYRPLEVLADDDNVMKGIAPLIGTMARESRRPIPLKLMPMRGQDKETRASAIVGWFNAKRVFFKRADWNHWLVNELLIFPNAIGDGVDDGVDALSLLGRRLNELATPAALVAEKPKGDPRGSFFDATFSELFEENERKCMGGRPRL